MRIALIGTRGVPARYGGFETCVEEVGRRLVKAGHEVVVYCRKVDANDGMPRPHVYEGMELVHLPALQKKSLETLSHTALSVAHLVRHPVDAAVVFNAANAPFLPVLRARRHPGGDARRRAGVEADEVAGRRAGGTTGWPSRWPSAGPTRSSPTRRASPTTTPGSSAPTRP